MTYETETSFQGQFPHDATAPALGTSSMTIKIWKEDADATEESFPVEWEAPRDRKRY